jgi:hypothetical protein
VLPAPPCRRPLHQAKAPLRGRRWGLDFSWLAARKGWSAELYSNKARETLRNVHRVMSPEDYLATVPTKTIVLMDGPREPPPPVDQSLPEGAWVLHWYCVGTAWGLLRCLAWLGVRPGPRMQLTTGRC